MKLKCFALFLFILITCNLYAMLPDLDLNELIRTSDLIAEITVVKAGKIRPHREGEYVTVNNLVQIDNIYKGEKETGKVVTVVTDIGFEDCVEMKDGQKALAFLRKKGKDIYWINNLLQGYWIIIDDKFCGFGFNITKEQFLKALQKVKNNPIPINKKNSSDTTHLKEEL